MKALRAAAERARSNPCCDTYLALAKSLKEVLPKFSTARTGYAAVTLLVRCVADQTEDGIPTYKMNEIADCLSGVMSLLACYGGDDNDNMQSKLAEAFSDNIGLLYRLP